MEKAYGQNQEGEGLSREQRKKSDATEKASVTTYEWLSPFSSCHI
jgi:hypothetical protein